MIKKEKSKKVSGELIFGINPIVEVLKARKRKLISIYTTKPEPKGFKQIEQLMPKYPVNIQYVTRDVLHRMANTTDHQGILAWVHPYGYRKKQFEPKKQSFIVLLDGVQDPRNLGAIIRSAYCAGADGVILPKKNSAPLSSTAIKASAGFAEYVEIYQVGSTESAVAELKKAGYNLYLALFDGKRADRMTFEAPACLIIGGEGSGISKSIMSEGIHVTIPQRSSDISYNASVAAGVLLVIMGSQLNRI